MGRQVIGSTESSGNVNGADLKMSDAHDTLALISGEHWICVHTAPHKEFVAATNLARQGYKSFVPKLIKKVRHARQTRVVSVAFFPRYLFSILDPTNQQWRPINSTIGVKSLIMESGRPKPVPEGVVETLVQVTNEAGSLDFRKSISIGQEVRLLTGPFANLVGTLARVDERGRVAVLLSIMGGERLITTHDTALQPVSDS